MFETFAALSTISMIVIAVVLYQVDRKGRQEDAEKSAGGPDTRRP